MEALLGSSLGVFLGFTVVLVGGCGFLMGQAVARTWRPAWQMLPYSLMLAAADRFLVFALFKGELLQPSHFAVAAVVIFALAALGFRLTRTDVMVNQYPWLYERVSLLSWREKRRQ